MKTDFCRIRCSLHFLNKYVRILCVLPLLTGGLPLWAQNGNVRGGSCGLFR